MMGTIAEANAFTSLWHVNPVYLTAKDRQVAPGGRGTYGKQPLLIFSMNLGTEPRRDQHFTTSDSILTLSSRYSHSRVHK